MNEQEFERYTEGPFLNIYVDDFPYKINKYGIVRGITGIIKPGTKTKTPRYHLNKRKNGKCVSRTIRSEVAVKRLFKTTKFIVSSKTATEVWAWDRKVDLSNPLKPGQGSYGKFEDTSEPDNTHRCLRCKKKISKSKTWCDECKQARIDDLSPYMGSRVAITSNSVYSNSSTSNLR